MTQEVRILEWGTWMYDAFMHYFAKRGLHELRKKVFFDVQGDVLELGPGTGVNLKYCNPQNISSMTYVDLEFKGSLREKATRSCPNVRLVEGDAQSLPFEDKTFDSVVFTLVFCSVRDPLLGLKEVKRVLKDHGKIFFIEHVEPHEGRLKPLFNRINPAWNSFSGGCNLNRKTQDTLIEAGFDIIMIGSAFNRVFIAGTGVKKQTGDTEGQE